MNSINSQYLDVVRETLSKIPALLRSWGGQAATIIDKLLFSSSDVHEQLERQLCKKHKPRFFDRNKLIIAILRVQWKLGELMSVEKLKSDSIFLDAYQSTKVALSEPAFRDDELGGCRPHFSKEDVAFIARLRKIESEQPKVKARSFMEFSKRIVKVDSSNESRKCCLRGHVAADSEFIVSECSHSMLRIFTKC